MWGVGTYSTNHHAWDDGQPFEEEARTVEVGAWLADGELWPWDEGATVRGWVTVDELARLIDSMKSWPSVPPEGFVASVPCIDEVYARSRVNPSGCWPSWGELHDTGSPSKYRWRVACGDCRVFLFGSSEDRLRARMKEHAP